MPDPVSVMIRQILQRSLQVLPKKRYQSVNAMRLAFLELLDRIDGVGVTHWALWESGRKIVERVILENPGLAFLRERETLFPTRLHLSDGSLTPVSLSQPLDQQDRAVLLTASGGMGKPLPCSAALLTNQEPIPLFSLLWFTSPSMAGKTARPPTFTAAL